MPTWARTAHTRLMGFRFRRRMKLFPGVFINVGKSGLSTSVGGPGATVNIGHGKTTSTVGLPGTGLSYRETTTATSTPTNSSLSGAARVLGWLVVMFVGAAIVILVGG